MKPLLIQMGHLIDPAQKIDGLGSLLIVDGRIARVGEIPPQPGYEVLLADGLVVCPGFIDLHCHLRQPGYEDKETIATGTKAAAKGGFTTVCCMPNTNPPLDNKEAIDYVKKEAEEQGAVRVLPIACVTVGRRGEELVDMYELASAGIAGFSDDGSPVKTPKLMKEALENSRAIGLPIIDHCEDTTLTRDGQINEGMVSRELKLAGIPAIAEEKGIARDLEILEQTGGNLHIAHVSTAGSAELIRQAKKRGVKVTAEVTPHHLTLTEMEALGYNTDAKVSPPLRTQQDNRALVKALREGVIDIIATDHAPHSEKDKQCDFIRAAFGISVFETALGSLMQLVHSGQISLSTLIARLTRDPARLLQRKDIGTLSIGASADITLIDTQKTWVVDTNDFISKGKNTPLAGATLKGRVMATLYQGRLVYRDESLKGLLSGVRGAAGKTGEVWQRKLF